MLKRLLIPTLVLTLAGSVGAGCHDDSGNGKVKAMRPGSGGMGGEGAGGTGGETDAGDAAAEDAPSDTGGEDAHDAGAGGTGGSDAAGATEVGADLVPDVGGDLLGN
jgi:hypothetical protein